MSSETFRYVIKEKNRDSFLGYWPTYEQAHQYILDVERNDVEAKRLEYLATGKVDFREPREFWIEAERVEGVQDAGRHEQGEGCAPA